MTGTGQSRLCFAWAGGDMPCSATSAARLPISRRPASARSPSNLLGGCMSSVAENRLSSFTNRMEPSSDLMAQGEIFDSHGISIDAWDRVWIADRDAHQIVVFDLSGKPILRIGDRHRPKWEAPFNHPTRAAVASDGADLRRGRIRQCAHPRILSRGRMAVELR